MKEQNERKKEKKRTEHRRQTTIEGKKRKICPINVNENTKDFEYHDKTKNDLN